MQPTPQDIRLMSKHRVLSFKAISVNTRLMDSERIYEKSQKCPQTCGFSLSGQIREQGETGSIDRRKQGNEFADSGSKKFRAAKCAAHGLGWFDSEADV